MIKKILISLVLVLVLSSQLTFAQSENSGSQAVADMTEEALRQLYESGEISKEDYEAMREEPSDSQLADELFVDLLGDELRSGELTEEQYLQQLDTLLEEEAVSGTDYMEEVKELQAEGKISNENYLRELNKLESDNDISDDYYKKQLQEQTQSGNLSNEELQSLVDEGKISEQDFEDIGGTISNEELVNELILDDLKEEFDNGQITEEEYINELNEQFADGDLSENDYIKELEALDLSEDEIKEKFLRGELPPDAFDALTQTNEELVDELFVDMVQEDFENGELSNEEYLNQLEQLHKEGALSTEELNSILEEQVQSGKLTEDERNTLLGTAAQQDKIRSEQEQMDASLKETRFDISDVFQLPDESGELQPTDRYLQSGDQSPIVQLLLGIITFATQIIGSIAVILFIVAGFMFMLSQGEEQGVTKAKEVVKYAVIGLAVTFLSYTIVIFIQTIFNR